MLDQRMGFYLSLAGGILCTLFGLLLLRWLGSLLYIGLVLVLAALLQRMTYKTLASILTVVFSIFYLVLWWLMTSGLSMIFGLYYAGFIVSLLGIIGGMITIACIRGGRS
jgi:apolipoprotein N-acyltransferase